MDKGAPMQRYGRESASVDTLIAREGGFVDYGGYGTGREWNAQWFGVRPGRPLGHPTLLCLFLVGPGPSFSPISEALPNSLLSTPFLEYCQT